MWILNEPKGIKSFLLVMQDVFREFVLHKPTKYYAFIYMGFETEWDALKHSDTDIQTGEIDISIFKQFDKE